MMRIRELLVVVLGHVAVGVVLVGGSAGGRLKTLGVIGCIGHVGEPVGT